ncbi:putative RNA-binding domain superfamily [Helianthus annuus]|nr:putative RNA-binding domain superfamily [Helianthus annuus]
MRPLGYAFVDFDDLRDALDAIRDLDVYRNQCPLVEKPMKTSLKSQRGSFKNFFNRRKELDGEKVDDHRRYCAVLVVGMISVGSGLAAKLA